jgi:probable rRNA maturation factor
MNTNSTTKRRGRAATATRKKSPGIAVDFVGECDLFEVDLPRLSAMLVSLVRLARLRSVRIGICITDDRGISKVNRRFLSHKGATDVISFDLSEEKGPRIFDITVNAQRAAREACNRGHSGEAELALYAVHGILHCLGYDDLSATDAKKMHAREDEILESHGYGRTYAND